MLIFVLIKDYKPVQNVIDIDGMYNENIAFLTAKALGLVQLHCSAQGSIIHLPSISLEIGFGCNGLETVMIYCIAVLVFPGSWKKKMFGIAAGFLIIQGLNFFRILALAYSAVYFQSLFEIMHIYVAQGVMIAVAVLTFLVYLNYVDKEAV